MAEDRQLLTIRLPRGLHGELVERAGQQGVSLNLLCVALLAGATSWTEGVSDREVLALAAARDLIEWP